MLMMIVMVPNQPMHEVGEVPSRHGASVPVTDVAANICFSTLTRTITNMKNNYNKLFRGEGYYECYYCMGISS